MVSCTTPKKQPEEIDISFDPKITGFNLKSNFTIKSSHPDKFQWFFKVNIAGENCGIIDYIDTESFECITRKRDRPTNGSVLIQYYNQAYISKEYVHFVSPSIEGFSPKVGPMSGGTNVKITGRFFNERNIRAFFGSTECVRDDKDLDAETFYCKTRQTINEWKGYLRMEVGDTCDAANPYNLIDFNSSYFRIIEDPTIISVSSNRIKQEPPKGYAEGGSKIYVNGTNFHVIQNPQFCVYLGSGHYSSNCTVERNEIMVCESPHLLDDGIAPVVVETELYYGFEMDGVEGVKNMSGKNLGKFQLFRLMPSITGASITDWTGKRNIWIIVSLSVGFGLFCIIYAEYVRRSNKRELEELRRQLLRGKPDEIDSGRPLNDQSHLLGYDEKWEYPRNALSIDKDPNGNFIKLGGGFYGVVYRATPQQPFYNEIECRKTVAVKKENSENDKVIIANINCSK